MLDTYETRVRAMPAREGRHGVRGGRRLGQHRRHAGKDVVDFPASSPSVVGCGGTRLTLAADGSRSAEVVWNDNPTSSATGGGLSTHFPGRQVPDIAGADPQTGYQVLVDGESFVYRRHSVPWPRCTRP